MKFDKNDPEMIKELEMAVRREAGTATEEEFDVLRNYYIELEKSLSLT